MLKTETYFLILPVLMLVIVIEKRSAKTQTDAKAWQKKSSCPRNTRKDTKIFRNKRQSVRAAGLSCFELIAPSSFALFECFRRLDLLRLFFLRQLHCEIDSGDHAVGPRDSFAGNIKRSAVIRT